MANWLNNTHEPESKPIVLGPRLIHQIRSRIHELEARYPGALTRADRGELQRLRELLRMGGSHV